MKTLTRFLAFVLATVAHAADKAVAVGSKVTLTATSEGTAPITYDWFKSGVKVFSGNPYVILKLASADAGVYVVQASNDFGNASSDGMAIVVGVPPTKPNVTVESGGVVNMTIKVPKGSKVAVTNN